MLATPTPLQKTCCEKQEAEKVRQRFKGLNAWELSKTYGLSVCHMCHPLEWVSSYQLLSRNWPRSSMGASMGYLFITDW